LPQFLGGFRILPAPHCDTDQQGAGRLLLAPRFNLEDGQVSLSGVRLTGRAGTTVEIACL
jgi:hypothetical protein